jgi:hypothetical protein
MTLPPSMQVNGSYLYGPLKMVGEGKYLTTISLAGNGSTTIQYCGHPTSVRQANAGLSFPQPVCEINLRVNEDRVQSMSA